MKKKPCSAEKEIMDWANNQTSSANEIPEEVLLAAEFGYKACERGENIQLMFKKLYEVLSWKEVK